MFLIADFIEFSMRKLFNIQQLLHCRSKHDEIMLLQPYSLKFSNDIKSERGIVVWEMSI